MVFNFVRWYRYLQNLRQCYDIRHRWPYLGNALKYFVAAQVGMIGVFQPSAKSSALWLLGFVVATLYQVWWDVVMDWGLLERRKRSYTDDGDINCWGWELRQRRIYNSRWIYYAITSINFLLRFCWTLSFLPTRYLTRTGVLTDNFAGSDELQSLLIGPVLASAEIIRRTLWGILRLEWEIVKRRQERRRWLTRYDKLKNGGTSAGGRELADETESDVQLEMSVMRIESTNTVRDTLGLPISFLSASVVGNRSFTWCASDMSDLNEVEVIGELCLYSMTFVFLGMIAAAHRGTA
jgi:hypothetical protein